MLGRNKFPAAPPPQAWESVLAQERAALRPHPAAARRFPEQSGQSLPAPRRHSGAGLSGIEATALRGQRQRSESGRGGRAAGALGPAPSMVQSPPGGAPLSALCFSGGGIRSATFNLGVLQGLAEQGLLASFDYLSTVSGGGYIGAWLAAWSSRAGGLAQVLPWLRPGAPPPGDGTDPIGHLRAYNHYLAPRGGAASVDAWTLAATVLRNIFLNWLVVLPLLLAVLMLPRLLAALLSGPAPAWVLAALPWLAAALFALGLGSVLRDLPSVGGANPARAAVAAGALAPLALAAVLWCAYDHAAPPAPWPLLRTLALALAPALAAWLGSILAARHWRPLASPGSRRFACGQNRREWQRTGAPGTRLGFWGGRNSAGRPAPGKRIRRGPCEAQRRLGAAGPPSRREHKRDARRSRAGARAHHEAQRRFGAAGPPSRREHKRDARRSRAGARAHHEAQRRLGAAGPPSRREHKRDARRSRAGARAHHGSLGLALAGLGLGTGASLWLLHRDLASAWSLALWVTLAPPLVLAGLGMAAALCVGLASPALRTLDREWAARAAAVLLLAGGLWMLGNATVLLAPAALLRLHHWLQGALAALASLAGWLSALAGFRSAATAAERAAGGRARLLPLAAAAFLALVAASLALATGALLAATGGAGVRACLFWLAAFAAWAALMARSINVNKFSLAGMYRDRLIRAYLGASNPKPDANHFTGFSPGDDLPLHALAGVRPLPVFNLTLNLVAGDRLAWQQRKAESFTASPLACGSPRLGFRPAAAYGGRGGLTLGTAMALSGAALSPNMGYYSSPLVGFLMTLFNLRLGAWLGNPGPAGAKTWRHSGPRSALAWLAREALGLTNDRSPYVYLSDGGHFEDLGLYEMVRRRCRRIVVVDAGQDPDLALADLGNALRKIRIDFGVAIAFEDGELADLRARRRRCASAAIPYAPGEVGALLYLKPVLLGTEAPDVLSYAAAHPAFPHQSTLEQGFDESQTESYRLLGLQTIEDIARHPVLAPLLGSPPAAANP